VRTILGVRPAPGTMSGRRIQAKKGGQGMRCVRTIVLFGAAISIALTGVGTSSAAVARSGGTLCSGGDIASGTYRSLTVTGFCNVPDGAVITVEHNLTVSPKAVLFAVSMSTLRVGGNLLVESGA